MAFMKNPMNTVSNQISNAIMQKNVFINEDENN